MNLKTFVRLGDLREELDVPGNDLRRSVYRVDAIRYKDEMGRLWIDEASIPDVKKELVRRGYQLRLD